MKRGGHRREEELRMTRFLASSGQGSEKGEFRFVCAFIPKEPYRQFPV